MSRRIYSGTEVATLNTRGARYVMRELSEILSDQQVRLWLSHYEVFITSEDGPHVELPLELAQHAYESVIYLNYDHVDVSTAIRGEDTLGED